MKTIQNEVSEINNRISEKSANDLLIDADNETLRRIVKEQEKKLKALVDGVGALCEVGNTQPLQTDTAIQAMRDVALAAISLARDVAHGTESP